MYICTLFIFVYDYIFTYIFTGSMIAECRCIYLQYSNVCSSWSLSPIVSVHTHLSDEIVQWTRRNKSEFINFAKYRDELYIFIYLVVSYAYIHMYIHTCLFVCRFTWVHSHIWRLFTYFLEKKVNSDFCRTSYRSVACMIRLHLSYYNP